MIGRTLGHYRISENIGAGGMGVVYRARDLRLERDVAIKVLPPQTLSDEAARKRFRTEALALSKQNHPSIETVHDFDTQDGIDFLVLEYIPGTTLSERLSSGPLPEAAIVALGAQLGSGLAAAHGEGVIHRDLKPANLRVTPDGRLKILDFGLARLLLPFDENAPTRSLTQAHGPIGTLPYMAPEVLGGKPADARTDLYAAGTVLYEMATGRRAFPQDQGATLVGAILHEAPTPPRRLNPGLSAELERIILKALEKDPARRYRSARELLADLEALRERSIARRVRRLLGVAGLGIAAAVALVLLLRFWPAGAGPSLAVLPFDNASGSEEAEYLSDGITESIINAVSRSPNVRVIARASVFRYKGRQVDPREAARALEVRSVLTGRVEQRADRLRVTAELMDAEDGRHLWGDRYDRAFEDIFRIQDEIAGQISRSLRLRLEGDGEPILSGHGAGRAEAYELFLKGRYQLNKFTEPGSRRAIEYFDQAIALDPGYALAYAGIAETYYSLSNIYMPSREAMPRAREAALKALDLDPRLAEAYTSLALVRAMYDWDRPAAGDAFRRAVELSPGSAAAHHYYGLYFSDQGQIDEGIAEIRKALALDPLSAYIGANLGFTLYLAGRYDEAAQQLRNTIRDCGDDAMVAYAFLGLVHEARDRFDEAAQALGQALRIADVAENHAWLAHVYAVSGREPEARRILADLLARSKTSYVPPYAIAITLVGLGETDEAFTWLEKAYETRDEWLVRSNVDPRLQPLRSDPRYRDLIRRLGLRQN